MWLSFLQTKSNNKTYEKTIDISNLTTSNIGLLNKLHVHDCDNIEYGFVE